MKLVAVLASMLLGCIASVHAIPIEETGLSSRGQTTTNDDIASHENDVDVVRGVNYYEYYN
ncbi:hypothetical protein ACCO45_012479 [Purpureocillium lilacinum]|uniref:Uncharacterized protein n=1 Tax=Purpureocillium lilacinum TaxID=33203 RepID=A0ACC4D8J0_PURLI